MPETQTRFVRTKFSKQEVLKDAFQQPLAVTRELNNRSFYHFLQCFWPLVSPHEFSHNWHIQYLCEELEKVAYRVAAKQPRLYDLVINVPPGSTKTVTCSIMFPVWCWTQWYWMRFITSSYSSSLSLEAAEYSREIIRSQQFQALYPDISIKEDKDVKSNFKIVKKEVVQGGGVRTLIGGSRYSTSVGGTLTGFHGDILIVDDPLKPDEAASEVGLGNANRWVEQTLSTRKTNKAVTPTILIMQRLHQDDPSGHILAKQKQNIKHICIPGEIRNYAKLVQPQELLQFYKGELLDPKRLPWTVLRDMEADLGQYGYAGQVGQDPTPPGGGMFKVSKFAVVTSLPKPSDIMHTVRYWDKAATADGGAYTAGVKMARLRGNQWIILDVIRGRWSSNERERIIRRTAELDGFNVDVWVEQEPGSGGKESAQGTIRNLVGYKVYAEHPTGDKVFRADPYSVQVNNDAFSIYGGMWNHDFIEEHRFFPFSTYKDQVDAAAGAFNKLIAKKFVRSLY